MCGIGEIKLNQKQDDIKQRRTKHRTRLNMRKKSFNFTQIGCSSQWRILVPHIGLCGRCWLKFPLFSECFLLWA